MEPTPRKQSRIAEAKAEIEAARAAHRAASKRLDERRAELGQLELALRNIPPGTSENDVSVLVSRSQSLAALVAADSREVSRAESATERAVEDLKTVQGEATAYRQMVARLRHELESATGQLDDRKMGIEVLERGVRNLSANLAAAEKKLTEIVE